MNRWLFAGVALLFPAIGLGAEPPIAGGDDQAFDFSVRLGKTKRPLSYASAITADTTIQRIGVAWYEQVAPRVQLGLEGGKALLSQTGNASTAGIEPDGYYASVNLRLALNQPSPVQFYLQATYSYQRVEHDVTDGSVVLVWDEPSVQLGVAVAASTRLRLFGGGRWSEIDGQERVSGANAHTIDFDSDRNDGGFIGLDFAVDRDGYVGVEAYAGAGRGGEIYFKRRF